MTERNAQRPSLSQLYRRFAGSPGAVLPNADDLLELGRVPHAEDAAAPLVADLLRLSRELEAPSAELGQDLRAAFDGVATPAHRRAAPRRAAVAARRWRGVAAIAASVLAIVGVIGLQHGRVAPTLPPTVAATAGAPADRIFAAVETSNVEAKSDVIFRDQFSAPASDQIFRSNWNG
jgi:hypothetical protein